MGTKSKARNPRWKKTDDVFYGGTGIRYLDQLLANQYRLRPGNYAFYVGGGSLVCPDGTWISERPG